MEDVGVRKDGVPEALELDDGHAGEAWVPTAEEDAESVPAVVAVNAADDELIEGFAGPGAARGDIVELEGFGVCGLVFVRSGGDCDHDVR